MYRSRSNSGAGQGGAGMLPSVTAATAGMGLDPSDMGVPPHRGSSPHLAIPATLVSPMDMEGRAVYSSFYGIASQFL
jgi:hypothetical protein